MIKDFIYVYIYATIKKVNRIIKGINNGNRKNRNRKL